MLFYCTAHIGEFTVPTLFSFDPNIHVKPSDMCIKRDHNNLRIRIFHISCTKTSREGEDVSFTQQNGLSDPELTLLKHLSVNEPPPEGALFAYCFKNNHCSLNT
jgi:hypothetical protein